MKKLLAGLILALMGTLGVSWAAQSSVATGTFAQAQPGLMSFSAPRRNTIFITNVSGDECYVKFYSTYSADTDSTVSAISFDAILKTSETLVLDRLILQYNPIRDIGVYGASTSSTQIRITGW